MDFDDLTEDEKVRVASSFETTPELLPFIPYLLQDLWELGSSPEIIINILNKVELPSNCRLLDLACGKGALSIQIARKLRFKCYGVDLFESFIAEARQKANDLGLSEVCKFETQDINHTVKTKKNFDVVLLAAAESLLGTIDNAIKLLRQCVRSGGYIIYDGAFMNEGEVIYKPEYSVIRNYEETIRLLTTYNDQLVLEVKIPGKEIKAINDRYNEFIKKRANELLNQFPEKKELLLGYVKRQEKECEIIENDITGCVWCLQKK